MRNDSSCHDNRQLYFDRKSDRIKNKNLKGDTLRLLFLMRGEIVVFQLSEIYYKVEMCIFCDKKIK